MDSVRLRRLIEGGERMDVEFKRGRKATLHDTDIVHAAMCLANGPGGTLLLGVEDDGTVTGVESRHGDRTDPTRIRALILNKTQPPLMTTVDLAEVDGHEIVVVEVPSSRMPVGTTDGVYRRRAMRFDGQPECVAYTAHDLVAASFSGLGRDYARVVVPGATRQDLARLEFERFRTLASRRPGDQVLSTLSDDEIAQALGAIDSEQGEVTLGGLLLFGTEDALRRHVPAHEVAFQEDRPGSSGANEIARLPLFRAMEFLMDRVEARHTEEELMWGVVRIPLERIPRSAAREAIANGLVHRDYGELGITRVHLTDDAFSVSSPGGFPPGVTAANLLSTSQPRSPMLADAFSRAGLVERTGRGVGLMFDAVLRAGRAEPDYSGSNDHTVVVRFPTSPADVDFARSVVAAEAELAAPLSLGSLRVLQSLHVQGPSTVGELARDLELGDSEARALVNRLVRDGLAEARGATRGRRIHLTAAFHRSGRERAGAVRARNPEPIQQSTMVLEFVERYGSISRGEAAELCKVSDSTASRLLRTLAAEGSLVMRGSRRWARYEAPKGDE